jgi:hypothetical protein
MHQMYDSIKWTPGGKNRGHLEASIGGRKIIDAPNLHQDNIDSHLDSPGLGEKLLAHPAMHLENHIAGGEGMRGFYGSYNYKTRQIEQLHDKDGKPKKAILPAYADNLAKKLHGPGTPDNPTPKTEIVKVHGPEGQNGPRRVPVFGLRITPEMRERILAEGTPFWGDRDPVQAEQEGKIKKGFTITLAQGGNYIRNAISKAVRASYEPVLHESWPDIPEGAMVPGGGNHIGID